MNIEKKLEAILYGTRWLLAPIYLGLSLAILLLAVKFFQELFHVIPHLFELKEVDTILLALSLIDLALVGGLLVMVMFSGYENFVSTLNVEEGDEKLSWIGQMDANSLKNKVASSIVAISSIHLLKIFMDLEDYDVDRIKWYMVLHLTFVVSAFAMGMLDKLTKKTP